MGASEANPAAEGQMATLLLDEKIRDQRRERMLMFMLVELLTILTFVAMGFAFITQNEVNLGRDYKRELEELRAQHEKLQAEHATLQQQYGMLKKQFDQIVAALNIGKIVANPPEFENWLDLQRSRIGAGLPACEAQGVAILQFSLRRNDVFRASQGNADASAIDGVLNIVDKDLSLAQLRTLADPIFRHGLALETACVHRVNVYAEHSDLNYYLRQTGALRAYFRISERGLVPPSGASADPQPAQAPP